MADRDHAQEQTSDVWPRLHACLTTPPPTIQPGGRLEYWGVPSPYPKASEAQLRRTESELGFPLPPELRRFYTEVANGGFNFGRTDVVHGADGGCPEGGVDGGDTIERLVWRGDWHLHPRLEAAMLHHPGRAVLVDSPPGLFLRLGQELDYAIWTLLEVATGRIYSAEYADTVLPTEGPAQQLFWFSVYAPSLSVWFADWLDSIDQRRNSQGLPLDDGILALEQIETDGLRDPDIVWRGTYRLGSDWWDRRPENVDHRDEDRADGPDTVDVGGEVPFGDPT
jgi:hypothetical protein